MSTRNRISRSFSIFSLAWLTMFMQPAFGQGPGFASSLVTPPHTWNGSVFAANFEFPTQLDDMSEQPWMVLDPSNSTAG